MNTQQLALSLASLIALIKRAAFEPILTGPLLLALTRGPPELRLRLLRAFPSLTNARRLPVLLRTLKWLFALGLAGKVNDRLNAWAQNHWQWRKQGAKWDFANQKEVAIVTGGCSGFGHLMVKGLAGKMKVVVLDVQDLPADLDGRAGVSFYKCDITSKDAVAETAAAIRRDVGIPTILINNAGIAHAHTILDTSEEYLEKIFRVNLLSHFTLIKEFLPGMMDLQKGHIVSIASMASYFSGASIVDYCCTKAGVLALHEGMSPLSHFSYVPTSLNQELKHRYGPNGRCIQTTVVHPMWAQTPLVKSWEDSLMASKTITLPPSAIADPVVKQVLSGRAGQIYVPESAGKFAGIRGWPHWLQEHARDGIAVATAPR
ncbi:hypothetical protein H2199_000475 [Coniosporium tulheliwenetii]|uniref:Uncharacterized protein n=1 Tax=Coniosporium tulheliwenetii TaxID=3383036 RepID=A0ACC2ZQ59_9PEZI|nr:hypothetical protein H2199_000475 [Cladosporium sp. JES 115]